MPIFVMFITALAWIYSWRRRKHERSEHRREHWTFLMKIAAMAFFVAGAFEAYDAWPRSPDTSVIDGGAYRHLDDQ
ncbi:hypothetical protein [Luteibacter sp. 9133]|uniref:hypothetical protein n=1 Tax=Luteibacter sp. 9133 TaxID=1500891 RepID=UPI0012E02040|nr:hypothetical protein [Luteibacter sp. 9133]